MAFVRKMANKVLDLQGKNEEVSLILDSIPEWKSYIENDLSVVNKLESQPLASDPRKKGKDNAEEDIEFFFKIKSNFSNVKMKSTSSASDDNKDDNDEEEEEELDFDHE